MPQDKPHTPGPSNPMRLIVGDGIKEVSTEDIKSRLLNAEPVHFVQEQEEARRTIESVWITEALKKGAKKIDIRNAIVKGDLDLRIGEPVPLEEARLEPEILDSGESQIHPPPAPSPQGRGRIKERLKELGISKIHLVPATISIRDSQLEGRLLAGFDPENKVAVVFQEGVSFRKATFSQEAGFIMATFSQQAYFFGATFSGGAYFFRATFSKQARFELTAFKGGTSFTNAEFSGFTFFFKNSKETPVRLKELPEGIEFPRDIKYDEDVELLTFKGVMTAEEKEKLLNLSQDGPYQAAINELFKGSQVQTLGKPCTFWHARFLGEVRFQEVDLSQCSFLHANIDKVDFRYCEFGDNREFLKNTRLSRRLGRIGLLQGLVNWVRLRPTLLKDEVDADKKVREKPGDQKLREERYEPVRRLYLELKKNFEDKKDHNMAGEFHYGEMQCRRKKLSSRWWRNILSLESLYYWSSGYGERPLRAFICLFALAFILFPFLYAISENGWPWNWDCLRNTFLARFWDSVGVITFRRIVTPEESTTQWGKFVLLGEFIFVPTQFALFALALRRKVQR